MTAFDALPALKLTPEREQQLAKMHTEEAAIELALHNTREAVVYTRRCCRGHLEIDALMSVCYDVLLKIARRFKPGQQKFFAFAKAGLRGAVKDYYRTLDVVKNAKTITRNQAAAEFQQQGRSTFSLLQNQENGGLLNHRHPRVGGEGKLVMVPIEVATGEIAEPDFDSMHFRERWSLVEPIIKDKCSELEKTVLTLLYTGGFNFPEIGGMLAISRQAVQAIQSRALKRVRNELLRRKRLLNQD